MDKSSLRFRMPKRLTSKRSVLLILFRNRQFTKANARYKFFENGKTRGCSRFAPLSVVDCSKVKTFKLCFSGGFAFKHLRKLQQIQWREDILQLSGWHSGLKLFDKQFMREYQLLKQFLVFTQSQETQKTIDTASMLVSQRKEIIKILLLILHQHGRHDVRWKPAIATTTVKVPSLSGDWIPKTCTCSYMQVFTVSPM